MAGCCRSAADSPFRIWNVKVFNFITLICVLLSSISFGPTYDAYLLELAKSSGDTEAHANVFVGSVESVMGMVALISALPIGMIADRVNKRKMLQVTTLVTTLGGVFMVMGILKDHIPLIYAGSVCLSLHMQVFMSCGQALLADSVPKEHLRMVIATNGSIGAMAYAAGPLVQILLIFHIGDSWNLKQLHIFLVSGFALWPLAMVAFYMLRPTRSELEQQAGLTETLAPAASGDGEPGQAELAPTAAAQAATEAVGATDPSEQWKENRIFGMRLKWFVPFWIEFCGLITSCGAGMTVKFFPLFFKQDYGFSPVGVNALTVAYTLAIGIFVQLCQRVAKRIGICQAAWLWHAGGTACLFMMWKLESLPLLVMFHILRGGIMNAKGPIDSAIVMDCVDFKYRGRWAALQSISRFSWAGSAILGGWLIDGHDYRFTFLITGTIYVVTCVLYFPLVFLVPRDMGCAKAAAAANGDDAAQAQGPEDEAQVSG